MYDSESNSMICGIKFQMEWLAHKIQTNHLISNNYFKGVSP